MAPSPVIASGAQPPARAVSDEFRTGGRHDDATLLRCGGCGDSAVLIQSDRDYGQLVRRFLGDHERCRSAVEITRSLTGTR
jgi:hypothetical protein